MFGFGSALKASVTPRIGSRGAISTPASIDAVMSGGIAGVSRRRILPPSPQLRGRRSGRRAVRQIAGCCVVAVRSRACPTASTASPHGGAGRGPHVPRQPVPAAPAVRAGRRPAGGDREARRGHRATASRFQTLLGVTGSGKTYTMANVIARLGRPALVLAPNKTLAAQLYSEMREFFPENAVEYFVSLLRLLPARGLRPVARPVHREGLEHQRAHRADAAVGDQVAARARATR